MSDLLREPARLFDVRGKVAVITGASGAFGALASRVLAAAGARLVLAAGRAGVSPHSPQPRPTRPGNCMRPGR